MNKLLLLSLMVMLSTPGPVLAQSQSCIKRTYDGKIINLEPFCRKPQSKPPQPPRPLQPVPMPAPRPELFKALTFSKLTVKPDRNLHLMQLEGEIRNISNKPEIVHRVRIQFLDQTGKGLGTTAVSVAATLKPQQVYKIKHQFKRDELKGQLLKNVTVRVMEII